MYEGLIKNKYIYIHITWNQCEPVEGMEGEEASLCLKSASDCDVFAHRKDCSRALHTPLYLKLRFRKFVYGLGSARSVSIFLIYIGSIAFYKGVP